MLRKIVLHELIGNESQALLFSAELKGGQKKGFNNLTDHN